MPGLIRSLPSLKFGGTAAANIAVASSQIGFREGSNNANPFGEWYGMNHVSWCAEFQSWSAAHSGCAAIIPKHAYTPAGAAWFQARGQWGHAPRVGALAYFYSSSQGRIHHVGLVAKVYDDGSFACVEGNTNNNGSAQGNGVYLNRRRSTGGGVGGFGYPRYAKPPAPAKVDRTKHQVAKSKVTKLAPGVRPGSKHPQTRDLQRVLIAAGYGPISGSVTDHYGVNTQAAVARFFRAHPEFASFRGDVALGQKGWAFLQHKAGRK